MNPGNQGLHGFEIMFHEAMHQWDEEIDGRMQKIATANKLKFNDLLSHAMIFYTTGEAMKTVVPSHVPYAEIAGIWKGRMGAFKPALDAHWKPYLEGKTTLDEALCSALAALRGRVHFLFLRRHERRNDGGRHQKPRQRQETRRKSAGGFANPAHQVGSREAADIADRIHQRNAAGGRRAAQERGRPRPERAERAPDAKRRDRQRDERVGQSGG